MASEWSKEPKSNINIYVLLPCLGQNGPKSQDFFISDQQSNLVHQFFRGSSIHESLIYADSCIYRVNSMKSPVFAHMVKGPCTSQNGSLSINSFRWAWVTVTFSKEPLSRSSRQTWCSPLKSQNIWIIYRIQTNEGHLKNTGID